MAGVCFVAVKYYEKVCVCVFGTMGLHDRPLLCCPLLISTISSFFFPPPPVVCFRRNRSIALSSLLIELEAKRGGGSKVVWSGERNEGGRKERAHGESC